MRHTWRDHWAEVTNCLIGLNPAIGSSRACHAGARSPALPRRCFPDGQNTTASALSSCTVVRVFDICLRGAMISVRRRKPRGPRTSAVHGLDRREPLGNRRSRAIPCIASQDEGRTRIMHAARHAQQVTRSHLPLRQRDRSHEHLLGQGLHLHGQSWTTRERSSLTRRVNTDGKSTSGSGWHSRSSAADCSGRPHPAGPVAWPRSIQAFTD